LRYVGSKNRIAKHIVQIIQSYIDKNTKGYLEPFVGGANVIDKITFRNKIGCDIHKNLIALLKKAQTDTSDIPERILETEYIEVKNNQFKYNEWYIGLVGFCASFGAKYFGGYARDSKDEDTGKWSYGAINNLKEQSASLRDIKFYCRNFIDIDSNKLTDYVIYCDIPYKNTTKYKTEEFPYEYFYEWCKKLSKRNTVLISEYDIPDGFECLLEIPHKTLLDKNKTSNDVSLARTERLYIAS
jgi:site-specific DNA-adenine methylase